MSAQNTPGPWVVVESDKAATVRLAAWICTIGNNQDDPAVFSTAMEGNNFIFGDKIADARLIAAAPEMLELLKSVHDELVRQQINFGPLIADAEALISKAEGQS